MKALVIYGKKDLRYHENWPIPEPAPGQVRVRVKAATICGSDLNIYKNGYSIPYDKPHISGHEISGVVEKLGEGVSSVTEGTRVAILPTQSCGVCHNCMMGAINLCEDRRVIGGIKKTGAWSGGMAEYVCVPAKTVIPIPADVSFDEGALLEIMGVGLHVSRQAGPAKGKTVVIIGAGSVGLSSMKFFQYYEAKKIIVFDVLQERLQYAELWGADHCLMMGPEAEQQVSSLNRGIKADIVLDSVGSEETLNRAMRLCRGGGSVIMAGLEEERFLFDYRYAVDHEIKLFGSITYTTEMYESLELLRRGMISFDNFITLKTPLSKGAEIFEELTKDKSKHIKVLLEP